MLRSTRLSVTIQRSKEMRVFLGGTCNESTWRKELIPQLKCDYFNPVVEDWTPECMEEEIRQRESCDICLYVITIEMTGVYAIAEAVEDSNKRPEKTIFCYIADFFTKGKIKSLEQTRQLISVNGAKTFTSLEAVGSYINNKDKLEKHRRNK